MMEKRRSACVCNAVSARKCDGAHQEGTQAVEAQEVDDGKVGPTGVLLSWQDLRLGVTLLPVHGSHHDLLPVLSSGTSGRDSRDLSSTW